MLALIDPEHFHVNPLYADHPDYLTPMEEIVWGFTDIIKFGKALY